MSKLPVLLSLSLAENDEAVRRYLRMESPLPTLVQRVVLDDPRTADRIVARWLALKIERGLAHGGSWYEAYRSSELPVKGEA